MLTRLRRTAALALKPSSDRRHWRLHAFLDEVDGVIHVGANSGQERWLYDRHHLNVLWIEPLPEMAAQLRKNIEGFPRQIALEYLLCDQDGRALDFYIANNQGNRRPFSNSVPIDRFGRVSTMFDRSVSRAGLSIPSSGSTK